MTTRLIVQEQGGQIQVSLHRAGHMLPDPAGDSVAFQNPLTAEERADLRWYLEDYLSIPVAVYGERGAEIESRLDGWGERLFDALFGPGKPGRDAYQKAMETAGPELLLLSNDPGFLGIPWELLRDPNRAAPLLFDLAGLDRSVTVESAAEAVPPGETLRVLVVIARPYGARDVAFRTIARPLMKRLDAVAGKVELEVLRPPTLEAMTARLNAAAEAGAPFHILHFDGHGAFGVASPSGFVRDQFRDAGPQGYLIFETEEGAEHPAPASVIAGALKDAHVPVAVFNACRSAAIDGGDGPEAAVATRLVQAGVASVVAMSHSVYAVAAAEFMAAFYEALFQGKSVSRAVTAGRSQMLANPLRPSLKGRLPLRDWVVPVHYARRAIAFPHLRPLPRSGLGPLSERLAALRAPPPLPEGVHGEEDLTAMGGVFFGRDAAFQELERALRRTRVAVVHGPGGAGKTELAKGFARWWRDTGALDRPDWVFFHSFEPGIASFGLDGVVSSIGLRLFGADFIGQTRDAGQRRDLLLEVLRERRMLLVWDNVESVHSMHDPQGATPPLSGDERAAIRDFLAEVARQSRSAVILTSRTAEDWLGDVHRLQLGGLGEGEATDYADHLLTALPTAQARRAEPAFADLMEALDGHPLALRLVLPHLANHDAATLLKGLRGETPLPATPGGQGRHATLDACIDYSLSQLPPALQARLPLLSLFEGVADVNVLGLACEGEEMPERFRGVACAAWAETLGGAAAVGLLTGLGGAMFALHPALPGRLRALWRRGAGEGFADEEAGGQSAFITAYAGLGAWLSRQWRGGSAETVMAVLTLQRRSLGRFLGLALERGAFEEAQRILQPLNAYFNSRGLFGEAAGWARRCRIATEGPDAAPPLFGTLAGDLWLFAVGSDANRAMEAGHLDAAEAAYDRTRQALESATHDGARRMLAVAHHQLGNVAFRRGRLPGAEAWYRQSLAIKEALGDRPGMASSYHQLGMVAEGRGDFPGAEAWYRKSLEIEEALGNRPGMAISYHQLGNVAFRRGRLPGAEAWYRQSLAIKEALGDRPGMAGSYHQLGNVAKQRGDDPGAETWHRKSLEIREALGDRPGLSKTYGALGLLDEQRGALPSALDWMVRAVALFPEFPHPMTQPAPLYIALFTAVLGLPALEESWRRQTGAPLPDAVRAALPALTEQARAEWPELFAALTAPPPTEPTP
ncbi:CHAT domain-containing protein [Azospirillum cavernae]|uniref:CHAT domain-containing protein n=1 Tax=Azospirillum cavernae TaxID=2320860 RepID=A0A418VY16_9PROT|nr:tetratricopeptide repeat protein [Azospirillum cavernae]RJF82061.1 CHAT domain-containing protein [Azospirillum cavernae]